MEMEAFEGAWGEVAVARLDGADVESLVNLIRGNSGKALLDFGLERWGSLAARQLMAAPAWNAMHVFDPMWMAGQRGRDASMQALMELGAHPDGACPDAQMRRIANALRAIPTPDDRPSCERRVDEGRPVAVAARRGDAKMVAWLLAQGASAETLPAEADSLLFDACLSMSDACFMTLFQAGSRPVSERIHGGRNASLGPGLLRAAVDSEIMPLAESALVGLGVDPREPSEGRASIIDDLLARERRAQAGRLGAMALAFEERLALSGHDERASRASQRPRSL